jgi:chromosome segregation ATPase
MARPSQFTEEDYSRYIEGQLTAGRSLSEITPNELQTKIGGKYSKCQEMLSLVASKLIQEQGEQPLEMPQWFKEFVAAHEKQAREAALGQWMQIGREIKKTTDEATQAFEAKLAKYRQDSESHLAAVNRLEAEVDGLNQQVEQRQEELVRLSGEAVRKDADIERMTSDLADIKAKLLDVETKLSAEREAKAKAEGEIIGYQREIESLKTDLIKREGRIETLEIEARKVADLSAQVASLQSAMELSNKATERMKVERDHAAVEAAKLSQQVEDLRADLASMKTANKDSEKARNTVEREKAKIEGKIELLEEQLAKQETVRSERTE